MTDQISDPLRLLVYGNGLAAELATIALAHGLGQSCDIIRLQPRSPSIDDCLFGGHAPPSTYEFFRSLGVTEPNLILGADTAFSLGTRFTHWSISLRDWVQSFQQPLPAHFGIPFHQTLASRGDALEPYLISAQAARQGVFAHPPADPKHPLSRAEYGYQFSADSVVALLSRHPARQAIERKTGDIADVIVEAGDIAALRMDDGTEISADLFIDCSGLSRVLITALGSDIRTERSLIAREAYEPQDTLGPPYRTIAAQSNGWQSTCPVQGGVRTLTVTTPTGDETREGGHSIAFVTGRLDKAWVGNCVALGHASGVLEPLSPAPMHLLELNLNRLIGLIPHTQDMRVERREFNRLFANDYDHSALFHESLFSGLDLPNGEYWREQQNRPMSALLTRKLTQFQSRGLLVQYDYEPFNLDDWAVHHFGLGRSPSRHDLQATRVPATEIEAQLSSVKQAIKQTVASMPPHHIYMTKFKDYLMRTHNVSS